MYRKISVLQRETKYYHYTILSWISHNIYLTTVPEPRSKINIIPCNNSYNGYTTMTFDNM